MALKTSHYTLDVYVTVRETIFSFWVVWAQVGVYLPIHMLAWHESVEGSWADGSLVAPSADSTSAAWLVMSWYSWMNWYRFMMRDASIIPVSLLIWKEENSTGKRLLVCL